MSGRVLIAGVGNIFLGDDGFGVEVAKRLACEDLPDWAHVVDYGIRGMHLAYDLANGYESAILVDATARGGQPGTIYVIEPDLAGLSDRAAGDGDLAATPLFNAHGMQPDVVFGMLGMLGAGTRHVLVVGCEPARLDYEMGLSEPVAAAVDEAVRVVRDLVAGGFGGSSPRPAQPIDRAGEPGDDHRLVMKEWSHVPRDTR
jgi:hydrogenase maturation protease